MHKKNKLFSIILITFFVKIVVRCQETIISPQVVSNTSSQAIDQSQINNPLPQVVNNTPIQAFDQSQINTPLPNTTELMPTTTTTKESSVIAIIFKDIKDFKKS